MENKINVNFSNNNFRLSLDNIYSEYYNYLNANKKIIEYYIALSNDLRQNIVPEILYVPSNTRTGWTSNPSNSYKEYDDNNQLNNNIKLFPAYKSIYNELPISKNISSNKIITSKSDIVKGFKETYLKERLSDIIEDRTLKLFKSCLSTGINNNIILSSTCVSASYDSEHIIVDHKDVKNLHDYIVSTNIEYQTNEKILKGFKIPLKNQAPNVPDKFINYQFNLSDDEILKSHTFERFSLLAHDEQNNPMPNIRHLFWWVRPLSSALENIYSKETDWFDTNSLNNFIYWECPRYYDINSKENGEYIGALKSKWNLISKSNNTEIHNHLIPLSVLGYSASVYPDLISVYIELNAIDDTNGTAGTNVDVYFEDEIIEFNIKVKHKIGNGRSCSIIKSSTDNKLKISSNGNNNNTYRYIIELKTNIAKIIKSNGIHIKYKSSDNNYILKIGIAKILYTNAFYLSKLIKKNDNLYFPSYIEPKNIPGFSKIATHDQNQTSIDFNNDNIEIPKKLRIAYLGSSVWGTGPNQLEKTDFLSADNSVKSKDLHVTLNSKAFLHAYNISEEEKRDIKHIWIRVNLLAHNTDGNNVHSSSLKIKIKDALNPSMLINDNSIYGRDKFSTTANIIEKSIDCICEDNCDVNESGSIYTIENSNTFNTTNNSSHIYDNVVSRAEIFADFYPDTKDIDIWIHAGDKDNNFETSFQIIFACLWFDDPDLIDKKIKVLSKKINNSDISAYMHNKQVNDFNINYLNGTILNFEKFINKFPSELKELKVADGTFNLIGVCKVAEDGIPTIAYFKDDNPEIIIENDTNLYPIYSNVPTDMWPRYNTDTIKNNKNIIEKYIPDWDNLSIYKVQVICGSHNPDSVLKDKILYIYIIEKTLTVNKILSYHAENTDKDLCIADEIKIFNKYKVKKCHVAKLFKSDINVTEHNLDGSILINIDTNIYPIYEEKYEDIDESLQSKYSWNNIDLTGPGDAYRECDLTHLYDFYNIDPNSIISIKFHYYATQDAGAGYGRLYINNVCVKSDISSKREPHSGDAEIAVNKNNYQNIPIHLWQGDGHHAWHEWDENTKKWVYKEIWWSTHANVKITQIRLPAYDAYHDFALLDSTGDIIGNITDDNIETITYSTNHAVAKHEIKFGKNDFIDITKEVKEKQDVSTPPKFIKKYTYNIDKSFLLANTKLSYALRLTDSHNEILCCNTYIIDLHSALSLSYDDQEINAKIGDIISVFYKSNNELKYHYIKTNEWGDEFKQLSVDILNPDIDNRLGYNVQYIDYISDDNELFPYHYMLNTLVNEEKNISVNLKEIDIYDNSYITDMFTINVTYKELQILNPANNSSFKASKTNQIFKFKTNLIITNIYVYKNSESDENKINIIYTDTDINIVEYGKKLDENENTVDDKSNVTFNHKFTFNTLDLGTNGYILKVTNIDTNTSASITIKITSLDLNDSIDEYIYNNEKLTGEPIKPRDFPNNVNQQNDFKPLKMYGLVNKWHTVDLAILADEIKSCYENNIDGYHIEYGGWGETSIWTNTAWNDLPNSNKTLAENRFKWLIDKCRKLGLWLFVSVANDNMHLSKHGNKGYETNLSDIQLSAHHVIDFISSFGPGNLLIQPVAETQTEGGAKLETYCKNKLKQSDGWLLVNNNAGGRPGNTNGMTYRAMHPASIDNIDNSYKDVIMSTDHGDIIRYILGLDPDASIADGTDKLSISNAYGSTNAGYSRIFSIYSKCINCKALVCCIYMFNLDIHDEKALKEFGEF